MTTETLKQHALDFLKGLLAVVIANAGIAAVNYIGAHIPDAINYLVQIGAATSTIKLSR